jgi:glutamate-1-semialdehyde 2,1-aminomutase
VPNSPGVTPGAVQDTILLAYNNVDALRKTFLECGSEIAAVIVEPVAGNMGCVIGSSNFLYELRHLTQQNGAILIFDEVMSGFRAGKAGAGQRFSITPDLITLGKVIGGGLPVGAYGGRAEIMDHVLPIGAYGGRAEIMDHLLPVGKVFQAGTLSGNPLAMAAGMATVKTLLEKQSFNVLERKMALLAEGLEDEARDAKISVHVEQIGSMMTMFFLTTDISGIHHHVMDVSAGGGTVQRSMATSTSGNSYSGKITDWESASACDTDRYAKFFWGMLERGFYFPCSQFEAVFMSTEITEEEIQKTIDAAKEVFSTL